MTSTTPPEATTAAPNATELKGQKRRAPSDSSIPSRAAGTYQRTKASNACLVCRARKTKCDNTWPVCGFCKSTGGECQYTKPNPLRFDKASSAILMQLDRLESLLNSQAEAHSLCMAKPYIAPDYNPLPEADYSPENQSLHSGISPDTSHIDHRIHGAESFQFKSDFSSSSTRPQFDLNIADFRHASNANGHRTPRGDDVPPCSDVLSMAYSEMGIEAMLKWPVFERCLLQLPISTSATVFELLGQVNTVESSSTDTSRKRRETDGIDLDSETVRPLIENFLVNNNLKNPILDPSLLRKYGQEIVDFGLEWDGKSCLLLLVLAISSMSISLADSSSSRHISLGRNERAFEEAELFFEASQRRIGILYCENSLISTQCAFLTGVYLMHTLRIMAAWKSFVQAGTQCLAYLTSRRLMNIQVEHGGSRGKPVSEYDSTRNPNSEPSSKLRVLEDGLYWSCLKSEVELRLELGLPGSGITESRYPHIFPSPPNFEDPDPNLRVPLGESRSFQTPSFETDRAHLVTGWFFYLGEIALKRLMNRILLYRYRENSNSEEQNDSELRQSVSEFDLQLEQWYVSNLAFSAKIRNTAGPLSLIDNLPLRRTHSLPPPMRFSLTSAEPLRDILRWVLRGHRIDIIELLRFPAISNILNPAALPSLDPSVSHRQHSDTTIRLAREYLENAVQRISTNAEGFLLRHQGSWLTIRSCTRSALALLGARLKCLEESKDWAITGASDREVTKMTSNILPPRWRYAVIQVVDMLRVWEVESPDVRQLREIVEGLLGLCPYD